MTSPSVAATTKTQPAAATPAAVVKFGRLAQRRTWLGLALTAVGFLAMVIFLTAWSWQPAHDDDISSLSELIMKGLCVLTALIVAAIGTVMMTSPESRR